MIDIENKIFNDIANAIQAEIQSAVVYSEAIDVPSGFPCVSMEKQIRDIIDNIMSGYNFTRILSQPMPNIDRTIYRIVSRYTGIVKQGVEKDNDIVYTIYRK